MRKAVGSMVLLGLVIYLFVKGALVMRPKETVAALSALLAALAQACSGSPSTSATYSAISQCSCATSRTLSSSALKSTGLGR